MFICHGLGGLVAKRVSVLPNVSIRKPLNVPRWLEYFTSTFMNRPMKH